MKKFKEIVLRHDYLKHFFVGFFIFELAGLFLMPLHAFVIVLIIACAKEWVWDALLRKGPPDVIDALYTILPGLVVMAAWLIEI